MLRSLYNIRYLLEVDDHGWHSSQKGQPGGKSDQKWITGLKKARRVKEVLSWLDFDHLK